jgi:DeoR/GlpR family transcriptional regulator of sugar metabolism
MHKPGHSSINIKNLGKQPMIPEERREKILTKLKEKTIYTIDDLKAELKVSRVTVQRDVNILANRGEVSKIHGGVKLINDFNNFETRFNARLKQYYYEKTEIAEKALEYIKEDSTIFLDSSSTVYVLALELFKKVFFDIKVITISPMILVAAMNYPKVSIISTGGILRQEFNIFEGKWVVDFLSKLNIDTSFISAAGVNIEDGVTTSSLGLSSILAMIFERSKEVNLLVDNNKFYKHGLIKVCDAGDCTRIITDKGIDKKLVSEIKASTEIEVIY